MTAVPPEQTDIVDPTTEPDWNTRLVVHPRSSFFHSAEWAATLARTYRYKPCYVVSTRGGALTGLLPCMEVDSRLTGRRGVALPFTDSAEPLAEDGAHLVRLIDAATAYGERAGWRSWEIRGVEAYAESEFPTSATFKRHVVDLDADEDSLFGRLGRTTRRNVRKAQKEAVKTEISRTRNAVMAFHRLNGLTRRDHGLPPQPRAFFQQLYRHVLAAEMGTVVLARHGARVIAGAVYFQWGHRAYYKYGASDRAYQSLRANNLVMWEALKWCAAHGIRVMDLGRTEIENDGLRRFKDGWGARETDIVYCKYDLRSREYVKEAPKVYGRHNTVFRYMPMPLLRGIGRLLYRHVG